MTYTTIGGINGHRLNIRFTAEDSYYLTANFTLPGGVTHSVTKTVTVVVPKSPLVSYEYVGTVALPEPMRLAGGKTEPYIPTISRCRFTVNNPRQYCTYEWQVNGISQSPGEISMEVDLPQAGTTTVSCRERYGNETSQWTTYTMDKYGVQ